MVSLRFDSVSRGFTRSRLGVVGFIRSRVGSFASTKWSSGSLWFAWINFRAPWSHLGFACVDSRALSGVRLIHVSMG